MDTYDASELKRKLKIARDFREVPAKALAESAGVGVDAYYQWERPKDNLPNHSKLALLANTFRMDIRYFYLPEMTTSEADLDKRPKGDPIERIARKVEDIEAKIAPSSEYDPLAHSLKTRKNLREFVEMVAKLDDTALAEARGLVRGYLVGAEHRAEQEQASRENAG